MSILSKYPQFSSFYNDLHSREHNNTVDSIQLSKLIIEIIDSLKVLKSNNKGNNISLVGQFYEDFGLDNRQVRTLYKLAKNCVENNTHHFYHIKTNHTLMTILNVFDIHVEDQLLFKITLIKP